jgi:hypothetical protein
MGVNVDFERSTGLNGEEIFKEGNVRLTPRFQVWHLPDAYFSHPKRPSIDDQEAVFLISRSVSVADLEQDAVVIIDDSGRAVGKWRNLQQVFDAAAKNEHPSNVYGATNGSAFPQYDLIEAEVRLPILQWLRQGVLSWSILKFFGVDVGDEPNANDPKSLREWGDKLSRIPVWNVAWLTDASDARNVYSHTSSTAQILLQFQPAPGRVPRRSAYLLYYAKSGLDLYGFGVNDLGRQLEDASDAIFNSDLRAVEYNADPAWIVDEQGMGLNIDEIASALREGKQVLRGRPGMDKSPAFPMQLPRVQDLQTVLMHLKTAFEGVTGVTSAVKGMANAQTLGQDQINMNQSNMLFNRCILRNAQALAQMMTDMVSDVMFYLQLPLPEAATAAERYAPFVKYAAMVSGVPSSEIEKTLLPKDGVENEIVIAHPAMPGFDMAAMMPNIMNLYQQTAGSGFNGAQKYVSKCLSLMGYSRPEDFTGSNVEMKPLDEERQMITGEYVSPSPNEDFYSHLMQHTARVQELTRESQSGQMSEDDFTLLQMLEAHVIDTQTLQQQALALQQQQAAMQAAAQPQPVPGISGTGKQGKQGIQGQPGAPSDSQGQPQPSGQGMTPPDVQGQPAPQMQMPQQIPGGM